MTTFADVYSQYDWVQTATMIIALVLAAVASNAIAKRIVLQISQRLLPLSPFATDEARLMTIVRRLSNVVPALVVRIGIDLVPHLTPPITSLIRNVAAAFMIATIAVAINGMLRVANDMYQRRPDATIRPIKGYIQVLGLIVYSAAAILVIAALMDRSPLLLLSGIGALAAVLMLVFKDTILSFVASVQIGSNDIVRVGDWIEMPQLHADGDVIDIALHTVKVQNWDKTVTTIPTYRLINEPFKNWRGMSESGGRRIKRAVNIDQNSVRFLSDAEIASLRRFALIADYLDHKKDEIARWNNAQPQRLEEIVNARRLTNMGTFRAYVLAYLLDREDISKVMTLIVRQLSPTESGLPLEIYCFTATTQWEEYERIQADIFDHLLAILPAFGLRLFQLPSGMDVTALAAMSGQPPADAQSIIRRELAPDGYLKGQERVE